MRTLLSDPAVRLLTLAGPGGVGKTRLALAAAEVVLPAYVDGACWVDLSSLADPALVVPTIAAILGVREGPHLLPQQVLATHLRDRTLLLVLDNFEHLLAARHAIDALLAECPGLTVLTTSREPLSLRREQVFRVVPLELPDADRSTWTPDALTAVPSVALFVDRARAADTAFTLSATNAAAVAELSRRLEGLPLAIELAASRSRILDPAALVGRLNQGPDVLRWETSDLPPRQQTLRATLDWSYGLLDTAEQTVFRRLGVFSDGFTLDAAAVVAATVDLGVEALDVLTSLVEKHLVRVIRGGSVEPQFTLLETVREYTKAQLASGEERAARDRHLAYFLALAEEAAGGVFGPDPAEWTDLLEREHDNLRAALGWAISTGDVEAELRLVIALWAFWVVRGHLQEGIAHIGAALSRLSAVESALQARMLRAAGALMTWARLSSRAQELFEQGLAAARQARDRAQEAWFLANLGLIAYIHGDVDRARAVTGEGVALARMANDRRTIGTASLYLVLYAIGSSANPRERERLRGTLDEPVARLREVGDHRALALLLAANARLLADVDRPAAWAALRQSLELARPLPDELAMTSLVPWLTAVLCAERLAPNRLTRLAGGIASLEARAADRGGLNFIELFGNGTDRVMLERCAAAAQRALGEPDFTAALTEGRELTYEGVIEEAMAALSEASSSLPQGDRPIKGRVRVSPREREVLASVAAGRTNKEIAAALFVAPSTVKSHVDSLFRKLGVNTRAQLVATAKEQGLL